MIGRTADWFNTRFNTRRWVSRYLQARARTYQNESMRCAFCPHFAIPGGKLAVTAQGRDGSWRRELLPLCPRCNRVLTEAGQEGRLRKATGERWFGGHTVGSFEAKGKQRPY